MRTVKYTKKFRKDYKREKSGRHAAALDQPDCHIWPDLALNYRKPDDDNLELVRLGSHSELGI